jgi:hypothetical protein
MRPTPKVWFFLRREPLYHKLQYSKVPKYDSSAAILGTVLGAFAGYLALATVGSGGTDLTDLTTLVAWALLAFGALVLNFELRNHHVFLVLPPLTLWLAPVASLLPWARRAARMAVPGTGGAGAVVARRLGAFLRRVAHATQAGVAAAARALRGPHR